MVEHLRLSLAGRDLARSLATSTMAVLLVSLQTMAAGLKLHAHWKCEAREVLQSLNVFLYRIRNMRNTQTWGDRRIKPVERCPILGLFIWPMRTAVIPVENREAGIQSRQAKVSCSNIEKGRERNTRQNGQICPSIK
jgi:hypothetical protein